MQGDKISGWNEPEDTACWPFSLLVFLS
uniref:Uncharacterized protein n=1 Tax=Anguilla anguilla TaxID=7936 RepID=A0A0E9XCY0_ANGAN